MLFGLPVTVDPHQGRGHQIMPALALSSGKLTVAWYDFRDDDQVTVYKVNADGQYSRATADAAWEWFRSSRNSSLIQRLLTRILLGVTRSISGLRRRPPLKRRSSTPPFWCRNMPSASRPLPVRRSICQAIPNRSSSWNSMPPICRFSSWARFRSKGITSMSPAQRLYLPVQEHRELALQ